MAYKVVLFFKSIRWMINQSLVIPQKQAVVVNISLIEQEPKKQRVRKRSFTVLNSKLTLSERSKYKKDKCLEK